MKSKPGEINEEQRAALALARMRALVAAGRGSEAATELRQLAADHPRDGRIQEALATALWEAKDPGALTAWQNVEVKSRSGSERWPARSCTKRRSMISAASASARLRRSTSSRRSIPRWGARK